MKRIKFSAIVLSATLTLASSVPAFARDVPGRLQSGSEIIVDRMTGSDLIPAWVLKGTKCVATLKVVKLGLWWGGQGSTGLVSCRTASNEWSEPSFFSVDGVSFGLQIGVQFLQSVILFQTDFAREILNHPSFQIGADVSAAAGPVGGGEGVGVMPNANLLTYDRSFGLYVGATVNGFILAHQPALNEEVYGAAATPQVLLTTPGTKGPEIVQPFVATMNKYLPLR